MFFLGQKGSKVYFSLDDKVAKQRAFVDKQLQNMKKEFRED
jgi:hypothetical protein